MRMKRRSIICILVAALMTVMSLWHVAYADDLQDQMDEVKEKKHAVSAEMAELKEKIESVQGEINEIQKDIDVKQDEIDVAQAEIQQTEADIAQRQEGLDARLRTMYKNGSVGYLDVLLGSNSISEFLSNLEMIQRIYKNDQNTLVELENQHDSLEGKRATLEAERAELDEKKSEQQEKQEELQVSQTALQEKLDALNAEADAISAEIVARQEALQQQNQQSGSYQGGALMWPCDATIITSEFGFRIHPLTGIYTGHTGIDIGCSMNSPVYAAEGGTVILSEWYGGYGYAVVIDHGNGLSTLYGHNDYLIANVGDKVSRGQVVASSGSTGWSTGPHLHFEVRVNGAYTNPWPYLR